MADFNKWTDTPGNRRYNRIYTPPFYQALPDDAGNYNSLGQLVGTMRSISAPAYESWIGRPPSAQDMQAITAEEAKRIFKAKYWDAVQGDSIKSQILAEFAADIKSNIGNLKTLQRALNRVGFPVVVDGGVGAETLQAINEADTAKLYAAFRAELLDFYQKDANPVFSERLIQDLNRYYPERAPNDPIFEQTSAAGKLAQDVALTGIIVLVLFILKKYVF